MNLHAKIEKRPDGRRHVSRVTRISDLPERLKAQTVYFAGNDEPEPGFRAVLAFRPSDVTNVVTVPDYLDYVGEGDVVRVDEPAGDLRVLYRRSSQYNNLLVTERCNSRCLMCSQPPRDVDDGYLVDDLVEVLRLADRGTSGLGITGGEPTLLGPGLIRLLTAAKCHLPDTPLNVLSNGRYLRYLPYAKAIADVSHPNLTICVPLYSDVDELHDFVVQAKGAYDETLRGILNLGRVGVKVEIRIVLHRQTVPRLRNLADFIAANLPFVSHVALMGLEMTGFTKANLAALWIDPFDYRSELSAAVTALDRAGLRTSLYNQQLCLLPKGLWRHAVRSISDWKNVFMPECEGCTVRRECGGFFASATLRYSDHITPML